MGHIDFSKSADEIGRLVRGMNPWPSAFTFLDGKQLKIWMAKTVRDESGSAKETPAGAAAGEVTSVYKDRFTVATGSGLLDIYELQSEGKKRMSARDFLLSGRIKEGTVLG